MKKFEVEVISGPSLWSQRQTDRLVEYLARQANGQPIVLPRRHDDMLELLAEAPRDLVREYDRGIFHWSYVGKMVAEHNRKLMTVEEDGAAASDTSGEKVAEESPEPTVRQD